MIETLALVSVGVKRISMASSRSSALGVSRVITFPLWREQPQHDRRAGCPGYELKNNLSS